MGDEIEERIKRAVDAVVAEKKKESSPIRFPSKAVVGMIAEVIVIGVLGWVLVYGPKESQGVIAAVLGAAVGARVNQRSQRGTGLGSIRPAAYDVPYEAPGVMRAPLPSHTGFTEDPPPLVANPDAEWDSTVERNRREHEAK